MERSPVRLSEGLIIAAAPAYGYLLAYVYRRGFAQELTIPLEFIQVELSDVLFMTVSALAAGTVLLLVAHVVLSLAEALPQDRRWRLAYILAVVWLATNVPPLVIFRHHLERVWYLVVSSTAVTLSALWAAWSSPPPKIGIARLETVVGRALLLGFPILFLVALNTHELGTAQALDQHEYLVVRLPVRPSSRSTGAPPSSRPTPTGSCRIGSVWSLWRALTWSAVASVH